MLPQDAASAVAQKEPTDQYFPAFLLGGLWSLLTVWIQNGLEKSPEELSEIAFGGEYRDEDLQIRKKILMRMMSFVRNIDIEYETLCVEKKHIEDDVELVLRLSKQLSSIIKNHLDYFQSFDVIKVYYDNGQAQVRRLLTSVFGVLLENVKFKTVSPSDYRLFQVADLVCTLKLVSIKFECKISSKAEKGFFGSPKDFKENYSKSLKPKKMK